MIKSNSIILLAAAALLLIGAVFAVAVRAARESNETIETPAELPEEPAYAQMLFDTSYVHSLDIAMPGEDWDTFLDTCTDKEYWACDLIIDGELYPNAAVRAKGNSSMRMIGEGEKYSLKIEFDHYRDETFYGLDKLNLNNMVKDNSCMRDYLVYRMMYEFGVDAPLCSYVFVTVNGEDFGLYLAVEGVEDAFLERNYGLNYGELYKPDSISNHKGDDDGGMPSAEMRQRELSGEITSVAPWPEAMAPGNTASSAEASAGGASEKPSFEMPQPGGGFGGMGANDVKLQYIDDDPDSYPNIFDSAKTDVSRKDKYRLIEALRKLGERENLESTLDTEEVLRYFVSHIFTCNSDSYTGGMIHNYYLYEENGRLSIEDGRCTVQQGDVSDLRLPANTFDLATAFETVYFWPGLETCFAQVAGILKPGGVFMICNESDGKDAAGTKFEGIIEGMKCYTSEELETALKAAGFSEVQSDHHPSKPWITVLAKK